MSRYRWIVLRNRLLAVLFFAGLAGAAALLVQLAGAITAGRAPYFLAVATVLSWAAIYGLYRWRWLDDVTKRWQHEERDAKLERYWAGSPLIRRNSPTE